MLDKTSEKILKCLISKCNKNPEKSVVISENDFSFPSVSIELLNSVCYFLMKHEYIKSFSYGYFNSPLEITLTYKGYSYFEYKRIEKIEYVKKLSISSACSILISVITAIITTIILKV